MSAVLSPAPLCFDDWFDTYRPIANEREQLGFSNDDVYFCLDTTGSDFGKVKEALSSNPETVWTVVDCDDNWYLVNGYCKVNAIYYVLCEVPLTTNDFYEIDLED